MGWKETSESYGPWGKTQQGAPTLQSIARLLQNDARDEGPRATKVVIMAGAGISTASGIPDFRSPKTGLYANLKKYNLPYPEAIFDIDYFQRKPQPFFTLSKELYPGNFKPTLTHSFFKLLDDKGKLLRVFTQNIDTLERIAGLDADRIVEAHGSFATSRCIRCKKQVEPEWIREKVMQGLVARCPQTSCQSKTGGEGGLVKPDIVFFGEGLPERFFKCMSDLKQADLLIVVGTSLQVQPFASLVDHVSPSCPRLLLNLERVGEIASFGGGGGGGGSSGLDRFLGGMRGLMNETGFDFEGWTLAKGKGKEHVRDVYYEGKCDEGVMKLAEELGWADELRALHRTTCEQLDGQEKKMPIDQKLTEAESKAKKTTQNVGHAAKANDDQEIDSLEQKLSKIEVNDVAASESKVSGDAVNKDKSGTSSRGDG